MSTTFQIVTDAFLTYWAYAYCLTDLLLSENELQLTARVFQLVISKLYIKHVPTSMYDHQTNGQTVGHNSTFIIRLHHYVAEYQCD